MHAVSERDLLALWERTEGADPLRRAAVLLAAAVPGVEARERLDMTVGERDAALLAYYARAFGTRLEGFMRCPACDEALELELGEGRVQALLAARPARGEQALTEGGFELRFRPLTCADLEFALAASDTEAARLRLVERCVIEARADDAPVAPTELPEHVVSALAVRLAACDPQAEIRVAVDCPECGHAWHAQVDIATFLGAEIDAAAVRLLDEVRALAAAYGWSEDAILAMSRRRRQFYLESAV